MLFCGFHVGPKAPEVRRLIYKTLFQYQHVTGVNNFSILFIIISLVIDTAVPATSFSAQQYCLQKH